MEQAGIISQDDFVHPRRGVADQLIGSAKEFLKMESTGSIFLIISVVVALCWANFLSADGYHHFWETEITFLFGTFQITHSLVEWINDGLMAVFFFIVGLEIKREILVGELASPKQAMLPIFAAVGGMLVPGIVYLAFNMGTPYAKGWAIPMATDIAFALGALTVLGNRLPAGLKIFLAALAIADDLGGILIIACFYTHSISMHYLIVAGCFTAGLAFANALGIRSTIPYILLGIGLWFAVLGSGIHPTIAGVLCAFFIPAKGSYDLEVFFKKAKMILKRHKPQPVGDGYWYSILLNRNHQEIVHELGNACEKVETPLQRIEHGLHPWVVFLILPLFALSNAGLTFKGVSLADAAMHNITLGITLGLLIGKPVGILLFSILATKIGVASLPSDIRWSHILGVGFLAGIGFTVSLFISGLSFNAPDIMIYSKFGVFIGSTLSAAAGIWFLLSTTQKPSA